MDNVFECPISGYSGDLVFPVVFLGSHYRLWDKTLKDARKLEGKDTPDIIINYQGALALATFNIAAFDPDSFEPNGDDVPMSMLMWISSCVNQYIAAQINPKA